MKQTRQPVVPRLRGIGSPFASILILLIGCGDARTFKTSAGHIDPDSIPSDHSCFDGSAITLVRYSSACERESKSLAAEVHDGMVFSADDVQTLESPCEYGPAPAVEVSFDTRSHSLILDFSRVAQGDRFPDVDFDGYMFDVVLQDANGLLVDVTIDRNVSNLDIDRADVEWDRSHIEVNFAGIRYDQHSVLKLDLLFARVSPVLE